LMIRVNEPTLAEKRKSAVSKVRQKAAKKQETALSGFTFYKYKKCLLVKHPMGLDNPAKIPRTYCQDNFSRSMFWNPTLKGWVASTKDEQHLVSAGALYQPEDDPDVLEPLQGFSFSNYKKCLLVKHPEGLNNSAKVNTEFKLEGFSRSIYWNPTLKGWIASPKDEDNLVAAGATRLG